MSECALTDTYKSIAEQIKWSATATMKSSSPALGHLSRVTSHCRPCNPVLATCMLLSTIRMSSKVKVCIKYVVLRYVCMKVYISCILLSFFRYSLKTVRCFGPWVSNTRTNLCHN